MTILVTGGGGYIGSHMAHALVDAGEPVVVVDNLATRVSARHCQNQRPWWWAMSATRLLLTNAIKKPIRSPRSSISPPRSWCRIRCANPLGLLSQQHDQHARHYSKWRSRPTCNASSSPRPQPSMATRNACRSARDAPVVPMSPYGNSKLMSEIMLKDAAAAHKLNYVILRYFNVAGADPRLRTGQATVGATPSDQGSRSRPRSVCGRRSRCSAPTTTRPDGTCIPRLHSRQRSRACAFSMRFSHLRRGGASDTFNCGYGHGYSVLDVLGAVEARERARFCGATFGAPAGRPGLDRRGREAHPCAAQLDARNSTISTRSWRTRSPGSASSPRCVRNSASAQR